MDGPAASPGSACSGCRSGAGARSSQDCRGQRQTAATPAHRLRLSLHKVRLRRPLRHLFATPYPGTSPAIRRSRSESRAGFCAMASRSARVWGGTPVWIAALTCKPCALRTGKAKIRHFVHKNSSFCGRKRRSTCLLSVYKLAQITHRGPITASPSAICKIFQT